MSSHRIRDPSRRDSSRRLDRAFAKGQLPWVKTPYWADGVRQGPQSRSPTSATTKPPRRNASGRHGRHPSLALDPAISRANSPSSA